MKLYPFQEEGVEWLKNHFRAILADEMGLGKTCQTVGLINACPGIRNVLIVCPASLKLNWVGELKAWLEKPTTITYVEGRSFDISRCGRIVVINYDILVDHIDALAQRKWDLVVCDEAHMLKNHEAKRAKAFFSSLIGANRLLFLTGSPIMNRPAELWPLLRAISEKTAGSYIDFTTRYCGGHGEDGRGWVAVGADNLEELNAKLAPVMLRRLKKDVLKDLPSKSRQVIEIGEAASNWTKIRDAHPDEWRRRLSRIQEAGGDLLGGLRDSLSSIRREDGLAKVPFVLSHVRMLLEAGEKVILFGWHRDVIRALRASLDPACPVIAGETSTKERHAAVERFQSDDSCRLIIGNIQSMGVGLTLTASSLVVFAELDWVPNALIQAEDRAHRIGQKNNVQVQYLVAGGTIDARMGPSLVRKLNHIDRAVDGKKYVQEAHEYSWFEEVKNMLLT